MAYSHRKLITLHELQIAIFLPKFGAQLGQYGLSQNLVEMKSKLIFVGQNKNDSAYNKDSLFDFDFFSLVFVLNSF